MTLSEYLEATGTSRTVFAARVGMSEGGFHKWVNGQRIPDSHGMRRIMKATKGLVTPNDFFPECRRFAKDSFREAAE